MSELGWQRARGLRWAWGLCGGAMVSACSPDEKVVERVVFVETPAETPSASCEAVVAFTDADGDGFGAGAGAPVCRETQVTLGLVLQDGDCDDTRHAVHPGAVEVCDGRDNDCNGLVDIDDPSLPEEELVEAYRDYDGDGYGSAASVVHVCDVPSGYVDNLDGGADCNDTRSWIHPGAPEACDTTDADCDGLAGLEDPDVDPSQFIDWYPDTDGDGYGETAGVVSACTVPSTGTYVRRDGDCDETDADINPGETEVCSGVDDDCNGLVDGDDPGLSDHRVVDVWPDLDGDGYGDSTGASIEACGVPSGYALLTDDCDDTDGAVRPDTTEVCSNGIDDDCNGAVDDCDTLTAHVLEWNGTAPVKPVEGVDGSELGAEGFDGGDFNGDGLTDLVVMSEGETSRSSTAYVLFGASSLASTWTTPEVSIFVGTWWWVRSAGDWDGDGYDDLVVPEVSTSTWDDFTWIPGGPRLEGHDTSAQRALAGLATSFTESSSGFSLSAVGPAGDLDADGYDDLWVYGHTPGTGSDSVWLLMGRTSVSSMQVDFLDHAAAWLEEGSPGGARLGGGDELSFGDLDGDGLGDAVWGHEWDDRDGTDVGQVYVSLGVVDAGASAGAIPVGYDWMLGTGQPSTVEGLGEMVQVLGDVDGDGYDDLLVGADQVTWSVSAPAWLFYGASSLSGRVEVEDADASFASTSFIAYEFNPGRGDVDGNGEDELVVVAEGYSVARAPTSYMGVVAMYDHGTRISGTQDVMVDGDWHVFGQWASRSGPERMVVGDVDGSGGMDLVFASPRHRDDYEEDGAVFVLADFVQ